MVPYTDKASEHVGGEVLFRNIGSVVTSPPAARRMRGNIAKRTGSSFLVGRRCTPRSAVQKWQFPSLLVLPPLQNLLLAASVRLRLIKVICVLRAEEYARERPQEPRL
jgi:hypothetical protein